MIIELYDALIAAGAGEEKARAAASALSRDLVTREYLDLKLAQTAAELKADLLKWMAGMLVAQGAIVATLVKLL